MWKYHIIRTIDGDDLDSLLSFPFLPLLPRIHGIHSFLSIDCETCLFVAGFNAFVSLLLKMPSINIDDAGRLRQLWTEFTTDVTPSHLPSALFSKRGARSPLGRLEVQMQLSMLNSCCKQWALSPIDVVQAVWATVLRSYSGSEDVMFVGIDTKRQSLKQQWVNTSIYRARCEQESAVISILDHTEDVGLFEADSLVSVPEALETFSTLGPKPCNTAIWLKDPLIKTDLSENDVVNENTFDYVLHIDPLSSSMTLLYHKPTTSRAQAQYILNTFSDILQSVCMDPYQPVSSVCQLSELDAMQIEVWNRILPKENTVCVDRLIEEAAQRAPDAPALLAWDGQMTYAEFNQTAGKMAQYLALVGVQPGDLVPICFEKSMWTVVVMIALWKLGAGWVPLDPKQPRQRLETIISSAQAHTVIASGANKELLMGLAPQVVVVDTSLTEKLLSEPYAEFTSQSQPRDISFVMFTSGSTGKPKGVVHDHASVASSALQHASAMNINSDTRALQFGAYTFIISTFEIFTTLIFGGCLCIPSDHDRHTDIRPAIHSFSANWAIFTPSFARSLNRDDIPSLKTLIVAGEAVPQDIIDCWSAGAQLINIYGASECSVIMIGRMKPNTPRSCIGRATGGLSWLVDPNDHDRLVPIGSIGELVIEGPTLARGYLADPEKTQAVYINNPLWANQNGVSRRFYKTGDLARYADDGQVHLIGRKDLQVKIRGQRVELTEIESHLRAINSTVKTAVSMVHPGGKSILVVFISSQSGFGPEHAHPFHAIPKDKSAMVALAAQMSQELARRLPSYMVPSAFLPLAYMPLTASGKTDRRILSTFGDRVSLAELSAMTGNGTATNRRMPTSSSEKKLCEFWADVLHYPQEEIGAEDNFFHLGGDSIEAMNLTRRCRVEGFQLQVQDILGNLTLDGMAKAMVPARSTETSPARPFELLGRDIETVCSDIAAATGTEPGLIQDAYPCTPLQVGLMALSSTIPGSYIARHVLELPASLSTDRFQEFWEMLVSSNDVLRTTIVDTDAYGTVQVVTRSRAEWKYGTDLERYLQSDKETQMNIGDALTRHGIITGTEKNLFVLTIHHSIYDGLSLDMVFNDLLQMLQGDLPPARAQFHEFVRHVMEKNTDNATEEFWRAEFSEGDLTTFPTLPSVTHKPLANESFVQNLKLNRGPSDFTTATLIRGAWSLLQARYCDAPETVFGCTLSGRNAPVPGVEDIVGPVIATVPIKAQVDAAQPVTEFLQWIQSHTVDMTPAQNFGLQNIARVSESAAAACNFQTLLVIQPVSSTSENGILKPFSAPHASFSTVALTLECSLGADGSVEVHAHFDNAILSRPEVSRLVRQFEHVLHQLAEPAGTITELEMISPQDKENLLQWNATMPDMVIDCIHSLVTQNNFRQPHAPAICAWDGSLTYHELEAVSSKLAAHLINAGVGPEVFVPLCFEKSMWTIVAMLGTMKAGGAFVPMDASQPLSRMEFVIKEVGARVMLCSEEQLGRCPGLVEKAIAVGPLMTEVATPRHRPTPVSPSNAAYVIFTSGSTGTPKGSVVEHRAFSTGAIAHKEGLQMGRRVLQFASYTFDASILEILSTLVQGGCVCVPTESERRGNIAEAMTRMNVDWAVLTPSFVNTIDPTTVPTLKTLCLAGEAMTASHVAAWTPHVQLVNGYGPSECCVCTSSSRNVLPGTMPNDIGTAVGCGCWVVDRDNHNKLAPIGAVGELLIEGNTLARHYLNNKEKTEAAFISQPDWLPFNRCPRLYKTGDLVKYAPDGSLLFFGRKDTQVKIRGQRVELGEIEYHLTLPHEVSQAVVSYPKTGVYANKLVGIVELAATAGPDLVPVSNDRVQCTGFRLNSLADHLSETLPVHMVPVIWFVVEKIPSSSSTKVDRKTVDQWLARLPSDFEPAMGIKREAPAMSTLRADESKAQALSHKIADLINHGDNPLQGREFNIAATGIDSVQVISLASFIKQHYGVKVPVSRIMDGHMTVRSLASYIDTELTGGVKEEGPAFDVMKEADSLVKNVAQTSKIQKTVFVTGVTGFLGTQILRQLCDRSDVGRVIAHVRANTSSEAFARVKETAVRAQWWSDYYLTKLNVWAGNLAEPQLGLKPTQWASLTGQSPNDGIVHAMIHAGAAVNWNAGTEVLRAANVQSTVELIRATVSSPVRPRLVYVSGGLPWHPGETDAELAEIVKGANGYAQTKYLSELLVKQLASSRPDQFAITKPGLILGTPEEGVANTDDFVWRLVSAVVDARVSSQEYGNNWIFVTSSTRVAEETINQAFCPAKAMRTVTHMLDGLTEHEFWDIFHRELRYPLQIVPHETWLETMRISIQKEGNAHPLWPVAPVFDSMHGRLGQGPMLGASEMISPSQKMHVKATIRRNVQFLVEAGYVASPTGQKVKYIAGKAFQRTGNVWDNVKRLTVNGVS